MAAVTGSEKYSRIETFLDNIDQVRDPSNLEEPFRSLWLRMHGDLPTLMSEEDTKIALSGVAVDDLSDIEITSSEDQADASSANSIEVVSPKDVGPTFEMKVEDKRVKFKAAGEDDLLTIKVKEEAAAKVVNVQKITAPLKGIGGGAAKVTAKVRDMAIFYRDAKYDDVVSTATEIEDTVKDEDFRKSLLIEIQRKITEYEGLGGDETLTKERFKELSTSFKEKRDDFLPLLQATNKLAEDSIKHLITTEEVLIADVKEPPKPEVKETPVKKAEEEKAIPPKKEKPKLPGETDKKEKTVEIEEEGSDEEEEAAPKPVIKIVKKKVVVLKMRDDDEKPKEAPAPPSEEEGAEEDEDFSIDLEEEQEEDEEEEMAEEEDDEVPKVDKIMAEQKESVQKALDKKAKEQPDKTSVDSAFQKIQVVYKASVKLHEQGKDVAQIFDVMNLAEQARQKGDMRMYVGLAGQLESMLISMQKR